MQMCGIIQEKGDHFKENRLEKHNHKRGGNSNLILKEKN